MSAETLSRIQFPLTVSFHFLFPPATIGLGMVLVVLQSLRLWTGKQLYLDLARFWTRVFGLIFAMGVATGIVLEFEFGTNWAHYARFAGDVLGSPLAIEGIYAFFLEAGFLALLLFGWRKIGPRMHLFATCMVALGSLFSAIWILVANSWMQTPAGYHLAREVKVVASGKEYPIGADLGSEAFTVREVPLPADYVVTAEDLPHVRAVIDDFGVFSTPNHAFNMNIYNSASPEKTLGFMSVVALVGVPIVLTYTITVYCVFRGKVVLTEESY
jgi:cytochrome d ubiquinol oxidase subunit I